MQFLIETERPALPAVRGRQVALCPSLAAVRNVAAEHFADDELALAQLDALGDSPEGELRGEPGSAPVRTRRLTSNDCRRALPARREVTNERRPNGGGLPRAVDRRRTDPVALRSGVSVLRLAADAP